MDLDSASKCVALTSLTLSSRMPRVAAGRTDVRAGTEQESGDWNPVSPGAAVGRGCLGRPWVAPSQGQGSDLVGKDLVANSRPRI